MSWRRVLNRQARAAATGLQAALGIMAAFIIGQACHGDSTPPPSTQNTAYSEIFGDAVVTSAAVDIGPADPTLQLQFALVLSRNETALENYLREVYDPNSTNYRAFLTPAVIQERYGPTTEAQQQVLSFMQGYGVTLTAGSAGLLLYGDASVTTLEQIFSMSFRQFQRGGQTFIAPASGSSPKIPSPLQSLVSQVLGLTTQPALDRGFSNSVVSTDGSPTETGTRSGCASADKGLTPNQIRTSYGLDTLQASDLLGQGIHMALVEESLFSQTNVDQFTTCFSITNAVTPQVVNIGTTPTSNGGEPHLDIEVILSIAPRLSGLYVFQSQLNTLGSWLILFAAPLNTANTGGNRVTILSSSLAMCELHWTDTAITGMEKVMKTLAAAGISVFVSAGDGGSTTRCSTTELGTGYPATSQYVTAVGGTNLALNTDNTIAGSGVWNDHRWSPHRGFGASGGGTSKFVSKPSWQTGTDETSGVRTNPDVAFFADPYPGYAIYTGNWIADGGTSAAAPLLAGATALLQQKAARSSTTLDLAYIWIYRLATSSSNYQSAFYDITVGNNDPHSAGCCTAKTGYDLASGWGSMNFSTIATLLVP